MSFFFLQEYINDVSELCLLNILNAIKSIKSIKSSTARVNDLFFKSADQSALKIGLHLQGVNCYNNGK